MVSDTSWQYHHQTGSPARPPNLWFISSRNLWGRTVTQVLDPARNHSLLLFEDCTGGEGPDPPGSAPHHHPSPPQSSGSFRQILQGVTTFFRGSQFISTFLPMVFLLSFCLSIQIFPFYKTHPPPDPSLIPSFHGAPTSWLSPKLRFYFSFAFSVCLSQQTSLFPEGRGGEERMGSSHSSREWEFKSIWVQEWQLAPRVGFSSCLSTIRDVSGLCSHVHSPKRGLAACVHGQLQCGTAVTWDQPWGKSCMRRGCNEPSWGLHPLAQELLFSSGTWPWSLPEPSWCLSRSLTDLDL